MRHALLLILVLASCKSDSPGSGSGGGAASCDDAAENLIGVCDPFTGEDFRALCEARSVPLVTAQNRACVSDLSKCDKAGLEKCHVRHVTIACSMDADCPEPLLCDTANEECARCLSDGDCAEGRGCLMGLCFDKDSEFYKSLSAISQ